jgi:hypothetical protein
MKKGKKVPPEIEAVGVEFDWDNSKMFALDLPMEEMEVSELLWHLDLPFWQEGETWFVVRPRDVLKNPDRYPEDRNRIANSSLEHPIHIIWHRERWYILDGIHRLAKAVQLGITTVAVRKVPHDRVSSILAE